MSLFLSVFRGGSSVATHDFEGVTSLIVLGVLLALPGGIHPFVSDVLFLSVLQGSQFDYGQAYLSYYWNPEFNLADKQCVVWFQYISTSGEVLDVLSDDVIFAERNVNDVQVKRFVRSAPFYLQPGP